MVQVEGKVIGIVLAFALAGYLGGLSYKDALTQSKIRLYESQSRLEQQKDSLHELQQELISLREEVFVKQDHVLKLRRVLEKSQQRYVQVKAKADRVRATRQVPLPLPNNNDNIMSNSSFSDENMLQAPCQAQRDQGNLPIYLFTAGVEGAGHHALESVWKELKNHYDFEMVTYHPGLHSFAKDPDVSRAYQFSSIELSRHRKKFQEFLSKPWNKDKRLILDTRNSYPMGFGVGSVGHPDIPYLAKLDGELFDLRVLILYRSPTACALSAVRRFKVKEFQYKNYQYQARQVQESLTLINNAIPSLQCGKFLILPYEEFTSNPTSFAKPLADLVGVDPQILSTCFGHLRASKGHEESEELKQQKAHLKEFFSAQQLLWPYLTRSVSLPSVHIYQPQYLELSSSNTNEDLDNNESQEKEDLEEQNEADPEVANNQEDKNAKKQQPKKPKGEPKKKNKKTTPPAHLKDMNDNNPVDSTKYFKIRWFTHLGFNNMRFILEMGMYLANLLDRNLMVTSHLRMRKCIDEELCKKTLCYEKKNSFWCPIDVFLDWALIADNGGVLVKDENEFTKSLTVEKIPEKDGFTKIYDPENLWLDRLPPKIKANLNEDHTVIDATKIRKFSFWGYHLGCELSYFSAKELSYASESQKYFDNGEKHKYSHIYGFVDEYGSSPSDVLFIDGSPHHIGLTPTFWSSKANLMNSQQVWESSVGYNEDILKFAGTIQEHLSALSKSNTYVCVHLRRGDFVTAGWVGDAADLGLVRNNIASKLLPEENFYLATDEADPSILNDFRKMGAVTWGDVRTLFSEEKFGAAFNYLGFEDYIGLIEQTICSEARVFLGSKCSSFTGQILNLRRNNLGDTSYRTVLKPD